MSKWDPFVLHRERHWWWWSHTCSSPQWSINLAGNIKFRGQQVSNRSEYRCSAGAEWAWPALCPPASLHPPWAGRLLIQFVGTSSPAEGKFHLVLVGSYGAYWAQSIGIILLWMGRSPKLWHHLAVKLNKTLTDKTFFLLYIFPLLTQGKKINFNCHCTLYISKYPSH